MKKSHTRNCERVQNLDFITRSLYTTAAGLVNEVMEAIRGYGKVVEALDFQQQSILRKSGPFVKPTTSKKQQQVRQGQGHLLHHVFDYQRCKKEEE